MIDAKEIAKRVMQRAQADAWNQNLAELIAEEIDAAQNPKVMTRGEKAAERELRTIPDEQDAHKEQIIFGDGPPLKLLEPNYSRKSACNVIRLYLARIIDAECAAAVKEEREACATLVEYFPLHAPPPGLTSAQAQVTVWLRERIRARGEASHGR